LRNVKYRAELTPLDDPACSVWKQKLTTDEKFKKQYRKLGDRCIAFTAVDKFQSEYVIEAMKKTDIKFGGMEMYITGTQVRHIPTGNNVLEQTHITIKRNDETAHAYFSCHDARSKGQNIMPGLLAPKIKS